MIPSRCGERGSRLWSSPTSWACVPAACRDAEDQVRGARPAPRAAPAPGAAERGRWVGSPGRTRRGRRPSSGPGGRGWRGSALRGAGRSPARPLAPFPAEVRDLRGQSQLQVRRLVRPVAAEICLPAFLLWDCLIPNFSWQVKAVSCILSGLMFNTGIGQHILKNPLIVNSIIDKVGVEKERERVIG